MYQFGVGELCIHFLKGFERLLKVEAAQNSTKIRYLRYLLGSGFALYSNLAQVFLVQRGLSISFFSDLFHSYPLRD